MAEALLNHRGQGRFRAFSAGSFPKGAVHPLAIETLERSGLAADGLRSELERVRGRGRAGRIDFVVTVCDNAAAEIGLAARRWSRRTGASRTRR